MESDAPPRRIVSGIPYVAIGNLLHTSHASDVGAHGEAAEPAATRRRVASPRSFLLAKPRALERGLVARKAGPKPDDGDGGECQIHPVKGKDERICVYDGLAPALRRPTGFMV